MKNNILFLICMLLCPLGKTFARVETPEWQSQYAIGLNKLAPHAYVWPYKEGARGNSIGYGIPISVR